MKPVIVLVGSFVISLVISKISIGQWNVIFSGNLAICLMLCFTAMGHFMFTRGMSMMMPGFIPFKKEFVYITGVAEILLGIILLFPDYRRIAAIILIFMFVLMLPANIKAAQIHLNLETAAYDGPGPVYLWFRIPLQILFIAWAWYFSIGSAT